jgi:hypothetical protein
LRTNGPIPALAASAETAAIAVGPNPMPPHSVGMCGNHRPRSLAWDRKATIVSTVALRSLRESPDALARRSASAGVTTVLTNSRTRSLTSSISGAKVKSMAMN